VCIFNKGESGMNNDLISREALKEKLQGHKDLFINAWGGREGFIANASKDEKARVDELNVCIAEIVNAPTVNKCDNCDLMFLEKTRGKKNETD
jgi:hypothetical protein